MNTNLKTAKTPIGRLAGRTTPTPRVARVLAGAGTRQVGVAAFSSSI